MIFLKVGCVFSNDLFAENRMAPVTLTVEVVAAVITVLLVVIRTIFVAESALDVLCWAGPFESVQVETVVVLVEAKITIIAVDGFLRWKNALITVRALRNATVVVSSVCRAFFGAIRPADV